MNLNAESITKEVFNMLNSEPHDQKQDPAWNSKTSSYLLTCKKLFPQENIRLKHFKLFDNVFDVFNEWGLDIMSTTDKLSKQKQIAEFKADPKKNKSTVIIVYVDTVEPKVWTIAMFNDEGEFISKELIDDVNNELAVELNKEEREKDKTIKLSTSYLGLTLFNSNSKESLSVGFSILYDKQDDYFQKIRCYIYEFIINKFNDPSNVELTNGENSEIDEALNNFTHPVSLTKTDVKSIVVYVRNLSDTGRERINDLRQLARLWTKCSYKNDIVIQFIEIEDAIKSIESEIKNNSELIELIFDILYILDDEERCLDSFVSGILSIAVRDIFDKCQKSKEKQVLYKITKSYYNFLISFTKKAFHGKSEKVKNYFRQNLLLRLNEDKSRFSIITKENCFANVGRALFNDATERSSVIEMLTKTLEMKLSRLIPERWLEAFLDSSVSERSPKLVAKDFYFDLLYETVISNNSNIKDIDFLTEKCKEYFSTDKMDILIDKVYKWLLSEDQYQDFLICIQRALNISLVYNDGHPCQKLLKEFSKYKLLKKNRNFQEWILQLTFKLLRSSTYLFFTEKERCQNDLKELLSEDTVKFEGRCGTVAEMNMKLIRNMLHELDWEQSNTP